jgi:hypothetical protein
MSTKVYLDNFVITQDDVGLKAAVNGGGTNG